MNYMTKQRQCLLTFFAEHSSRPFTIEAIEKEVEGVSKSAIYRNINTMVAQGNLRRFQKDGSRKFLYQYIGDAQCRTHLHIKCSKCGAIRHMDVASSNALLEMVCSSTGYALDMTKTILVGDCTACQ